MEEKEYVNKNNIEKAFHYFDSDGDGSICLSEIKESLKKMVTDEKKLDKMFQKIDRNKDGKISKQ